MVGEESVAADPALLGRLAGADASPQSDIYSLGVLLFHLVTGSYPYVARSLAELRRMHDRGERKRLHDLRHSFASFLVNGGVSLYVVQGLLGHTQPRMTQRYAHLAQDTLLTAAEVVGQVVTRGEQTDLPGGGFAGAANAAPAPPQARSAGR